MADKFRKVIPIKITFIDGEAPTAAKLNSLSNQIRSGVTLLEKGIGDLWNQSGDSVLNSTPLQIPNLARIIGELKYLNPIIHPLKQQFVFRDHIGGKFAGKTEGYLTYVPVGTVTQVTGSAFTTSVASEYLVDNASEFWFDTTTGRFRTNVPLTTEIVEYTVDLDASNFQHYNQVLPSLIPDPRQDAFEQLRVEKISTSYYIHLPPRRPLTLTGTEYFSSATRPERYPGLTDIGDSVVAQTNEASVIVGGGVGQAGHTARLYWQKTSVSALADEHYRYGFSKEIHDALGSLAAGTELPTGIMYLWNTVTNTIIEDTKFYVADGSHVGKKWIIKVSSDSFNFDTVDTPDETEGSYSSGLVLVSPGASITRSLWQLASSFYTHKHDKSVNSDPAITHRALKEVNPPKDLSSNEHFGRYPAYLQSWGPSRWNADEHNSLLSRIGAQTINTSSRQRDEFNNAMLGHLLLANADVSGAEGYLNSSMPDDSFKIFFGDISGPHIYGSGPSEVTISGNLILNGNINPNIDNIYDLGSSSFRWRDLYLGPASLKVEAKVGDTGAPGNYTGTITLDATGMKVGHSASNRKLSLRTNSIDRFIIDENGKTTIGGTVPDSLYMLDIQNSGQTKLRLLPTNGTSDAALEIGTGRSGSGSSYLDLVGDTTHVDYGTRLIRGAGGANAISTLSHKGTGILQLLCEDAGPITFSTTFTERLRITPGGQVGLGTNIPLNNLKLHIKNAASGADATDIYVDSLLAIENNTTAYMQFSTPNTANSGFLFGTAASISAGAFFYEHSTHQFVWGVSATDSDTTGSMLLGPTNLRPYTNLGLDFGTTSRRWSHLWSNRGFFTENLQTATSSAELVARHAQNAIVARGRIVRTGAVAASATYLLDGNHWNISTISRASQGNYNVNLDIAIDQDSTIVANVATNLIAAYTQCFTITSTQVRIMIIDPTTGNTVDIPDGQTFTIAIIGAPDTLP